MKIALITGITGQDGSYLAELLLDLNYEVHGIIRRASNFNTQRIEHILDKITLHYSDITDFASLFNIVSTVNPDEIYNLAGMSHVKVSFDNPVYTYQVNALGCLNLLECIRIFNKNIKFYQASTSEMFGKVQAVPQNENTPFYPRSPYGVSKLAAHWSVINYRESYNLFACSGILFNHESKRRGNTFVTKKITNFVKELDVDSNKVLKLGNLNARRDWGCAKEYVEAMYLMLQQESPCDYVIATGITTSVREFVEKAFAKINIDIAWRGNGINEEGFDRVTGRVLVKMDERYYRPAEVDLLLGDSSKARRELNWKAKNTVDDIIEGMCE